MKILSGIQPTGQFHLGNYLGALKHWVNLQNDENECFYPIVDLHALTTVHNAKTLRGNVLDAQIAMLAIGFNPSKSTLFLQSKVIQHTELAWILATIAPVGDLERMTQYKDKSGQAGLRLARLAEAPAKRTEVASATQAGGNGVNAGLLTYPTLMAADILLYKAEKVPVGEDQLQHLEFARTIARKFNNTYGKLFTEPEPIIQKGTARLMSLQDPTKKMSKSLGPNYYIGLFEEEDAIRKKIKAAVTDSGNEIKYNPQEKPAISNLLSIFSGITDKPVKILEKEFEKSNYTNFKAKLTDALIKHLRPIQERYNFLKENPAEAEQAFGAGSETAKIEAEKTMQKVREAVGLK